MDENTTPGEQPLIVLTPEDRATAAKIADADRAAADILSTVLDMHLNSHTGAVETRAQLLLKNTGGAPLPCLPLRISAALHWESARLFEGTSGRTLALQQYRIPDDLDHTGMATELALALPEPLAPGKTLRLDLYYSGTLAASTQRLTAIGAPAGAAALTDWDTVSDTFTGLRGQGNVLWYPVTGRTAQLRDGDAVTRTVEDSRARNTQASFNLHLTLAYTGSRPDAAFFTGEQQPLKTLPGSDTASSAAEGGVVTADWTRSALGPHTPSLFITDAAPHTAADSLLRVVTDRADTALALGEAAARIRPMLTQWLGAAPVHPLDIIDLPIPGAAGFADGTLVVAPLTTGSAAALAPALIQPLTAAWLPQNLHAPWLREGIPAFLQAVWTEQTQGRDLALAHLAANAPAPQRAGSSTEEASKGLPLSTCTNPACARGKAACVFEMLRSMIGDQHLQQALSGWFYRVQQAEPSIQPASGLQNSETAAFEQTIQRAAPRDLSWFFRDWIDADHGLPDLAIVTVAPRHMERSASASYLPQQRRPVAGPIGAEPLPPDPRDLPDGGASSSNSSGGVTPAAGSWLVAVEVQNNGTAEAEVPVTVRAGSLTNTLPLRVPAHGRATIRIPFEAEPQEVLVNDGSVPEIHTSQHRRTIADAAPLR